MLTILSPEAFKTIPWKNGLGHTTELAINNGGNLDDFDWRLSIASVVNDGEFSNFSGYQRNLVLIEGSGLILDHGNGDIDKLTNLLDIAHFDGGNKTYGSLVNGAIKDFNVITNQQSYNAQVDSYTGSKKLSFTPTVKTVAFVYSLTDKTKIQSKQQSLQLPVGHLVKVEKTQDEIHITGKNLIIIQLTKKL
jgi:hypothetical protein